ncbi:Polyketide synthase PksL [Kordia antarctica]|uniref:Polyketide synthase PksL n=1 Tax=Kordia antarctica TaxID=1218801 RepID=A0A7L4ZHA3_9FLAO|nr:SDR family NAD(P)-dependent oxidoreductase [Kordia antarctica]QHI36098.1 Polyketide synthase PksL [Kordia antarctica]
MINFIEYIVSELKQKRLSKGNALSLIKQFSQNSSKTTVATEIHPLLHTNTSDLYQQSYSTVLTGDESFLEDHKVKLGENQFAKVLPGVAYLEMARVAIENALPKLTESSVLEIQNIVWLKPFFSLETKQLNIALTTTEDGKIDFEIYSQDTGTDEVVHCQGQLDYLDKTAVEVFDIEQAKSEMKRGELNSDAIYAAYDSLGLAYGAAHRVVSKIYQGENQLLAKLELAEEFVAAQDKYILHPSLLDGALQASIGLTEDLNNLGESPMVPFALENIRVIAACTKEMYVLVNYAKGSKAEDKIIKLDIDVYDSEGNICVKLKGFTSKTFTTESKKVAPANLETATLFAKQIWEATIEEKSSLIKEDTFIHKEIIAYNLSEIATKELEKSFPNTNCSAITIAEGKNIAEKYSEVALNCFENIQNVLKSKHKGKVHVQLVIGNEAENELLAGISGMLKTAALENPQFSGQIIFTDKKQSLETLVGQLRFNLTNSNDTVVKYESGKRYVLQLKEIETVEKEPKISFKEQGVYIITGGFGGLGKLFAEEILQQTTTAKVILTGRSAISKDKSAKLEALAGNKNRVEYRQLDILNLKEVQKCVDAVITEHKQLNGIIHSAGMISDNYILKKTTKEFQQVLEPKVTGTFNLDSATKDIDMDFMVFFSSGVSLLGNPGQSDYAVANGFLDQLATYRNSQKENNTQLYAINWPLWESGGMNLNQEVMDAMQRETGVFPLQTATGKLAFYQSMELGLSQMLVIEGDLKKVRQLLINKPIVGVEAAIITPKTETVSKPEAETVGAIPDNLLAKTREYIRKEFSSVLKIAVHKIDTSAALERYGIDSVVAMNLTGKLEKTFGNLSKTLFFEYQTIDELSEYISENFQDKLATVLSIPTPTAKKVAEPIVVTETKKVEVTGRQRGGLRNFQRQSNSNNNTNTNSSQEIHNEPIAIVGLSGRYPASMDIETYWNNLRDGKDCVTEVPAQRWDWRDYYTDDKKNPGKHSSKWGGFISGVDEFDPRFFNISPREASYIDPQERLFLQHAWMAVEDAGFTRERLQIPVENDQAGQVGVYVGVMYGEYNLSGSLASIANRVSYFLNLHGPSMTLDTMCSSSLTAIHLACQDLKMGRTNLAIAGGVNVSIDANKYSMLSSGQFISSDGHCQSFGEGGDGYIPGEGVGAVVLKKLSEAVKDKNHIYGIIKGSALNHGGKTNGYTVPNPNAQASAISRALRESGTDPKHISFVEAHGTGTKLGDPIEITALTKGYQLKAGESRCLVGSSKSNIGHCESAAGIAGLTKVLLQMKYKQIVPSLHSAKLNPNIDFEKSPFEINQTLRNWEKPTVDGKQIPRTAGLSSFGAGGSNAHIIIQEYDTTVNETILNSPYAIVPLSARIDEQLKQKVHELYNFIERTHASSEEKIDLFQLAYTLQIGREAMDERVGFIVNSIEELLEKLKAFVNGEEQIEGVFHGQVQQNKETISLFNTDTDFEETIAKWITQEKYDKIVGLWAKGLNLDWNKFYNDEKIQLLSLPTYPFAKEKYWNAPELRGKLEVKENVATILHPLVHANTSDLEQHTYSTIFSGEEFFIKDYQLKLNGEDAQKALPALAALEMARAAIERAKPILDASTSFELREISWGKPFVLNGNTKIDIALFKTANDQIDFEIYSGTNGGEIIHSQGLAVYVDKQQAIRYDLEDLKNQLEKKTWEAKDVYNAFSQIGFNYGTTTQVIEAIYRSQNQLLAEIRLPKVIEESEADFVLHPTILDSVVQASICLHTDLKLVANHTFTPVSTDSIIIHKAFEKEMSVFVRYAQNDASNNTICIDADICDANGNVCAQIIGLQLQQIELNEVLHANTAINLIPKVETISISELDKPSAVKLSDFNSQNSIVLKRISEKPTTVTLGIAQKVEDATISVKTIEAPKIQLNNLAEASSSGSKTEVKLRKITIPDTDSTSNISNDAVTPKPTEVVSEKGSGQSKEQLKQMLINTLAKSLYLESSEIDPDKSFTDIGLDSIVGVEWIKIINKNLDMELSSTKIYDYATINELAKFLTKEVSSKQGTSTTVS